MPTVRGEPEWLTKALETARREGRLGQEAAPRLPAGSPKPKKKRGTPEADFQRAVIDYAHLHGWKVVVFRVMRTVRANGSVQWMTPFGADGKGFFDTTFVRERLVFAELKFRKDRKQSPDQEIWEARLKAAGQEVYLWFPKHWPQIEEVLK